MKATCWLAAIGAVVLRAGSRRRAAARPRRCGTGRRGSAARRPRPGRAGWRARTGRSGSGARSPVPGCRRDATGRPSGSAAGVAWTYSASETPRSLNSACRPRFLSRAIWTALSGVRGRFRRASTRCCMATASASLGDLDDVLVELGVGDRLGRCETAETLSQ